MSVTRKVCKVMFRPVWKVKWKSGGSTSAKTAEGLLTEIGEFQWNDFTARALRVELSWRAWVWSRTDVSEDLPAPDFIRALADADLFELVESTDEKEMSK
jgi:hypothetical protein